MWRFSTPSGSCYLCEDSVTSQPLAVLGLYNELHFSVESPSRAVTRLLRLHILTSGDDLMFNGSFPAGERIDNTGRICFWLSRMQSGMLSSSERHLSLLNHQHLPIPDSRGAIQPFEWPAHSAFQLSEYPIRWQMLFYLIWHNCFLNELTCVFDKYQI